RAGQDEIVGEAANPLQLGDREFPLLGRMDYAGCRRIAMALADRRARLVGVRLDQVQILFGLLSRLEVIPFPADRIAANVGFGLGQCERRLLLGKVAHLTDAVAEGGNSSLTGRLNRRAGSLESTDPRERVPDAVPVS